MINITIQNSNTSITDTQNLSGISIHADNILIEHCIIQYTVAGINSIADNVTINHCQFFNNTYGIYTSYAQNNTITHSTFSHQSKYGIYLYLGSKHNHITQSRFIDNEYGIRVRATHNTINNNTFKQNNRGLYVCCDSKHISIYHNNFINNTLYQAKGNYHQNTWYYNNQSGGNYWSDYDGFDLDNDGIGDTPYLILTRQQNQDIETISDDYPLIKPISID